MIIKKLMMVVVVLIIPNFVQGMKDFFNPPPIHEEGKVPEETISIGIAKDRLERIYDRGRVNIILSDESKALLDFEKIKEAIKQKIEEDRLGKTDKNSSINWGHLLRKDKNIFKLKDSEKKEFFTLINESILENEETKPVFFYINCISSSFNQGYYFIFHTLTLYLLSLQIDNQSVLYASRLSYFSKECVQAMAALLIPETYTNDKNEVVSLKGKIGTFQQLLFVVAFRQKSFKYDQSLLSIWYKLDQSVKDYLNWQKAKQTVIVRFADNTLTELPSHDLGPENATLRNLLSDIKKSEYINIPDQFTKLSFDMCFSKNLIITQIDSAGIDAFLNCYRYLGLEKGDPLFLEKLRMMLLKVPNFKTSLKGSFFLPIVIGEITTLPQNKHTYVFYDFINQVYISTFSDQNLNEWYKKIIFRENGEVQLDQKINQNIYRQNYFDLYNEKRESVINFNIVALDNRYTYNKAQHIYMQLNWCQNAKFAYDLLINSPLTPTDNNGGNELISTVKLTKQEFSSINIIKRSFSNFSKKYKPKSVDIFQKSKAKHFLNDAFIKSFATDGIKIFMLAVNAKNEAKMFSGNLEDLKKTFEIEEVKRNDCQLDVEEWTVQGIDFKKVTALCFCQKTQSLILGSDDGTIKFLDINTKAVILANMVECSNAITYIALDKDERTIAINTVGKCYFYKIAIIEREQPYKQPYKGRTRWLKPAAIVGAIATGAWYIYNYLTKKSEPQPKEEGS